ncbi:hypothetical protein LTR53_007473 [Teratosphaeriaceae sp. CCFEE 6253]|nr:hypothetical protein LTR53_007473 [Teratosphaeriaceae sp. CCFEE 6253]
MAAPAIPPASRMQSRRPPAHQSVSLLHSQSQQLSYHGASDPSHGAKRLRSPPVAHEKASDSPSSLAVLGRAGSGESSNAETWFDNSNTVLPDQKASFPDNEPPFFMRHSSSEESPDAQARLQEYFQEHNAAQPLGLRADLIRLDTDGSSTEDFRGVIDDLTIENKKLKRRLKRYEKLHDAHLKDEKLFEVRIHGLPADKKRELEETLRKFAVSVGQKPDNVFPTNGYADLLPTLKAKKTVSSQANDSAYASMSISASGQGGSSGHLSSGRNSQAFNPSVASRREDIHSYLHHIPEGLMPRLNPAIMSEKDEKKLIVRRLEQLFAGRGAGESGHQQPLQQQEVSQLAATADRSALEAQGQQARIEGVREAYIMKQDGDDSKSDSPDEGDISAKVPVISRLRGPDCAEQSPSQTSIEQRPTRPLDLDPHRAQFPTENMAYFRHLGFSPPEPTTLPGDGHGWLYLNLLINMAQLHTINVTVETVQRALTEYSDKFELSADGRKVRWNGGRRASQVSSASGDGLHGDDPAATQGRRKRPKLSHHRTTASVRQARGGLMQPAQAEHRKLAYTPMFSHRVDDSETDSSSEAGEDEASSYFPRVTAGDSSGMTSARTVRAAKRNTDDGPIVFYNNTRFCTDLSAERQPQGDRNAPAYTKLAAQPLGRPSLATGRGAEKRGALTSAVDFPKPPVLADDMVPRSMEVHFPDSSATSSESGRGPGATPRRPIDLGVTGMGGVWPADNFAIDVQSRHIRSARRTASRSAPHNAPKSVPLQLAQILRGPGSKERPRAAIHRRIIARRRTDLPPSQLPPALNFVGCADAQDEESDSDEVTSTSMSPLESPRSPAPLPMDLPASSSDDDNDSDDDSDSSLDFLATAREADPESIRAKEREYDAHIAERLAELIPAGSSAATAGGGSGFGSPAEGVAGAEYQRAREAVRAAQMEWRGRE